MMNYHISVWPVLMGLVASSLVVLANPLNRNEYHMDKRRPEMDTNGFYGDTFNSGFGDFYPARRSMNDGGNHLKMAAVRYLVHKRRQLNQEAAAAAEEERRQKRLMSNSNGFYGDTFSDGFGDFSTTKKRKRNLGSMNAFHGDTFSNGFGDFATV